MSLYNAPPLVDTFQITPALFFSAVLHIILLLLLRDIPLFEFSAPREQEQTELRLKLRQELEKSRVFLDTPDQMRDRERHEIETRFIGNKTTRAADLSRKDTLPDDKAHIEHGTTIPSVQARGNQPAWDDLAPLVPGLKPIDPLQPRQRPAAQQLQRSQSSVEAPLQLPSTPKVAAVTGPADKNLQQTPRTNFNSDRRQMSIVKVPGELLQKQLQQLESPAAIKRSSPGQQNRMTHALERDMASYYMLEDRYGEYYRTIKRTIDVVWFSWQLRNKDVSIGTRNKPAILTRCTIAPDGAISELIVFVDNDADQFAANVTLDVLKNSAPFAPFPDYIDEAELPLYFKFHF